jgi:hypothetical protein
MPLLQIETIIPLLVTFRYSEVRKHTLKVVLKMLNQINTSIVKTGHTHQVKTIIFGRRDQDAIPGPAFFQG